MIIIISFAIFFRFIYHAEHKRMHRRSGGSSQKQARQKPWISKPSSVSSASVRALEKILFLNNSVVFMFAHFLLCVHAHKHSRPETITTHCCCWTGRKKRLHKNSSLRNGWAKPWQDQRKKLLRFKEKNRKKRMVECIRHHDKNEKRQRHRQHHHLQQQQQQQQPEEE